MAFKTFAQLTAGTDVQDGDLFSAYRGSGPLKSVTALVVVAYLQVKLAASFLTPANNLSELTATASTARTNLGLGTASTQNTSIFAQAANNLSDLASVATARTNLGALAATNPATTGAGTSVVNSAGGTTLDCSVADFHVRSISSNTTFTLSGVTAGKASSFGLQLSITSAAIPTFTGVLWEGGTPPGPGNGNHLLGFNYDGTSWWGALIVVAGA